MNRTPRHIVNIAIEQDGYNKGVKDTEERIIKLLEELFDKAENAETRRLLTMAIASIKGENNA